MLLQKQIPRAQLMTGFGAMCALYQSLVKDQKTQNECGGILAFVSTSDSKKDAKEFCTTNANILQKMPYQQCGIAFRNEQTKGLESSKFTNLTAGALQQALSKVSADQYMLRNYVMVKPQDDCFFKMIQSIQTTKAEGPEESKEKAESAGASSICVVHSRYASNRTKITEDQAHPVFDAKKRIAVFHNGFITNFLELSEELLQQKVITSAEAKSMSDSELIAQLVGVELDNGASIKDALKTVIETKLLGTWRLAVMMQEATKDIFVVTNCGGFYLGKSDDSVIVSSVSRIMTNYRKEYSFEKIENNTLYQISDSCSVSTLLLAKKMNIERQPKRGFSHIFEEEIFESVDAVNQVIDFGAKFIQADKVLLGGFDRAKEELRLVENLVIATDSQSKAAADYAAHIMRNLEVFNSVKVMDASKVQRGDLERLKYGGYLTLSIQGSQKALVRGIDLASDLGLTCVNVVNAEDSAITRVVPEKLHEQALLEAEEQNSDSSVTETGDAALYENDDSIGMYTKFGFCYSDVKAFVPQVIAMALVALWFSDAKTTAAQKDIKRRRQDIIRDISGISSKFQHTMKGEYLDTYKEIGEFLKTQQNLFILGKGVGFHAGNYVASKFLQVVGIHAEAYPSGEFRHGPLSMIDDREKTPVVFIVLNDEHLSQVLSNILQVKERGATTIILTNLADISQHINTAKLDYVIQLVPHASMFAGLQCVPPLQLICYYAAMAKGINPDKQILDAIDFEETVLTTEPSPMSKPAADLSGYGAWK